MAPKDAISTSHLRAAGWALAIVGVLAAGVLFASQAAINTRAESLESRVSAPRSRGLAVLRARLRQPNAVALFGSSELIYDVKNRPDRFFSGAPTGFTVVPIGSKAMTPLIQAIAIQALGPVLHNRPIVISLSPFDPDFPDRRANWFAGNFSRLHAATALTSHAIPQALRRETARQLMNYLSALALDPVLKVSVHLQARPSIVSSLLHAFVLPLAQFDRLWLTAVDQVFGALDVLAHPATKGDKQDVATPVDWSSLESAARAEHTLVSRSNPYGFDDAVWLAAEPYFSRRVGTADSLYLNRLRQWPAWSELATLIHAAQTIGAQLHVIGIPYSGAYLDTIGTSRAARSAYYNRLVLEGDRLGVSVDANREHDLDRGFLRDDAHYSPVGWLTFDHSMDDFVRRVAP